MANILKGYHNMSDAQIADQIALLRAVTMWNAVSPALGHVGRGTVQAVNWVWERFDKEKFMEPKVKELPDLIKDERESWEGKSRAELDSTLRQELANRAHCSLPASDTELSVVVIAQAARGLGVEEGLSPAQEALVVTNRFHERLLRELQKNLELQSSEDRRRTEEELGQRISEMSDEQREEIRKLLRVEQLTGETMWATLVKASAPLAIIGLVEIGGLGAYMALSRILYAVFTVLLDITLPFAVYTSASWFLSFITGPVGWIITFAIGGWQLFEGNQKIDRDLLAQVVWMGVMNLDEPFVPPDEKLPSWVPQGSRQVVAQRDAEFAQVLKERDAAIKAHEESIRALEQTNRALAQAQSKLQGEMARRTRADTRRKELEQQLPALERQYADVGKHLEDVQQQVAIYRQKAEEIPQELATRLQMAEQELSGARTAKEMAIRDMKSQEELIAFADQEIARLEQLQREKDAEILRLKGENEGLRSQQESAEVRAGKEAESRRREMVQLWTIHFPKFQFEPNPLRWAARRRFDDRLVIEKVLAELHGAEDPNALSRSKMQGHGGTPHMGFKLPGKVEARVFYQVQKDGKITICRIGTKHDDWGNDVRALN